MKAKSLFFLLVIGLILANCNCAKAQNKSSDKEVIVMLKEFYTAYFTAWSKLPSPDLKKIKALQKKYCTASLYNKITAQYKSGYVSADPFTQSQDIDILWFDILSFNKDLRVLNGYNVSYVEATSKENFVIHLTVIKQDDNFKIMSIR